MRYEEAIAYLQNLTKFGYNFGLERINELLRRLGNPHLSPRVIHIGGTNGKGSTLAMVASILRAAGYKTGTFTSPHLHSYAERYNINGKQIPRWRLAQLIKRLRPHLDCMVAEGFEHPTEFEVGTAIAFQYFYEEKVDFLVLEVGLGGAVDSTNVVRPLVTVITNVSRDHMRHLGNTVVEIAAAKAGIIKEKTPVITAANDPGARAVIAQVSSQRQAPLIKVLPARSAQKATRSDYRQVSYQGHDFSLRGQYLTVHGLHATYENIYLPLLGRHQLDNAAVAVAVSDVLAEKGYKTCREAIYKGLAETFWPARLEVFPGEPLVIIDGAHNHAGAKSLRLALDDYFPGREVILVLGILGDKERAKMVKELAPRVKAIIVTRPESPRALDWRTTATEALLYRNEVYCVRAVKGAVDKALHIAARGDAVCVAGSLYMVAEAREVLLKQRPERRGAENVPGRKQIVI